MLTLKARTLRSARGADYSASPVEELSNRHRLLPIGLLLLLLSACATTAPPVDLLDDALAAIERAERMGAVEHAPLELRFAREKVAGARLAIEERNYPRAVRLAEESVVNSELAVAKTDAAVAREESRKQRRENEQLSAELQLGGEGS